MTTGVEGHGDEAMWFVISTAVVGVGCAAIMATLGRWPFHQWIIAIALIWRLETLLVGQLLSLLGLLGSRPAWLAADGLFAVVGLWFWARRGRTAPLLPSLSRTSLSELMGRGIVRPAVLGATFIVSGLMLLQLVATLVIRQNLDDVLTAYLARVGYWIQHGDLSPYPASPYNSVQVSYPVAAQLPVVRSIVMAGGDRFVGLDQWVAAIVAAVSVYGLGAALGARRTVAYFCGLLFLMIPTVQVQTGIAMTDLVSMSCVLPTLLFGYLGWTQSDRRMLALSTIGLGLSLAVKQTVIFLLPGLCLVLLAVLVCHRARWRLWLSWVMLSIPVVGVIGGLDYVRNYLYYGHPLGDPESFELFAVDATVSQRLSSMSWNLRRGFIDAFFADVPPNLSGYLRGLAQMRMYEPELGTGTHLASGVGWTGPFIASFLVVGVGAALLLAIRRGRLGIFLVLLPALAYVPAMYWTRTNFSAAFSRYMLIPTAALLVAAAVGVSWLPVHRRWVRGLGAVAAIVLVLGAGSMALHATIRSGTRPLVGHDSAWGESQAELLERSTGFSSPTQMSALFEEYERCFSGVDRVAIMLPKKFPQSMLFGPDYRRNVLQLTEPFPPVVDAGLLEQLGVRLAVIDPTVVPVDAIRGTGVRMRHYGIATVVWLQGDGIPAC